MAKYNKQWQFELDFENNWKEHPDIFQQPDKIEKTDVQPNFFVNEVVQQIEPVLASNLAGDPPIILENVYDTSMDIDVPFVFYETGAINYNQTKDKYSEVARVQFYINIIDSKHWFEPYQHLIDQIKIYLVFRWWDGRIDSLKKYIDVMQEIPAVCMEALIISLPGEINFSAMRRQDTNNGKDFRYTLDKILNQQSPFDSPVVQSLVDEFLKKHKIDEEISKINTQDLSYFFYIFRSVLQNAGLGKIERKEMEPIFNQFLRCVKFICEKWFYSNYIFNDDDDLEHARYDFESRFQESESELYTNTDKLMRKIMKFSCAQGLSYEDIEKIYGYKFIVNMFASYMMKWLVSSSLKVYKKNAIVEMSQAPSKLTSLPDTKYTNNIKFSELIKKIPNLRSNDWWIIHTPSEVKLDKNKILAYPFDKWRERLEKWVANLDHTEWLIHDLELLLQSEWLSDEIKIFRNPWYVKSNLTQKTMSLSEIFEEVDRDYWKMIILQKLREDIDVSNLKDKHGDFEGDLDFPF